MVKRLNVCIARAGLCSRRKADLLIKDGKVEVNGKVVREPWRDVSGSDTISVGGKPLRSEKHVYMVLNKPKGVTSTVADKFAERTVVDLVPKKSGRVYPAGRLDKDTSGLMVVTNDGELCYGLTHPKFEIEKEYVATVDGKLDRSALERMAKGVLDEGELLKAKSVRAERSYGARTEARVIISEGKKRHIRRMFKCIGHRVLELRRVRIGSLRLEGLKEGEHKEIDGDMAYRLLLGRSPRRGGSGCR
ncbi:MAG: rRNA pseudouridine synthase [Candidatus Omnitrophica bacterium]|nr:rRNA pseudouridine synthase [Candidatus Omnitrophota bacterium]